MKTEYLDYNGKSINEGDTLKTTCGMFGKVIRLEDKYIIDFGDITFNMGILRINKLYLVK